MKELNQKILNGLKTDNCDRHGEFKYDDDKVGHLPSFLRCPECEKEKREARQKDDERVKQLKIGLTRKSSGIPKRFINCSFESYNPTKKSSFCFKTLIAYIDKFENIKKAGTSIIMCGKPGTGKTHLSCAIVLWLISTGYYVKYSTSYKILSEIKSTYNKASIKTDTEIISKYTSCDLLVIDEVGIQFGSEAEKVLFYQIINGRYENILPTILISNLNEKGVRDFIGERCFDRLKEGNSVVLSFDWESYRR